MKNRRSNTVILIPAFNEEASIASLLNEIHNCVPDTDIVVINDGSADRTAVVAGENGAEVLDLPCNLGVGGAVQVGFRYAYENGYEYAIRCDGDGQHPPSEMKNLVETMKTRKTDLVIGSRFLEEGGYKSTWIRNCGIYGLAAFLSAICRRKVTDPTSGFQMLNRPLLYFFSCVYPMDYPEPEALALMRREGYDFCEVPTTFRERTAGSSTIGRWGTFYYVVKVFLALLVDRARPVDLRYSRENIAGKV
ncbi:MAG: glycosyltransferase family 2 protein [Kiritimatiellae bacterium]|nr:glycosyltransferase family 2 protein [Kiritimatiellia bacterium]MDD5522667.1 glycosyltransferase family 2 protein [Kiritimatiellia bacterium]